MCIQRFTGESLSKIKLIKNSYLQLMGELTALPKGPRPLAVLNGPTSKASEEKWRRGERGRDGKAKELEGGRGGGRDFIWPTQKFWSG